MKVLDVHKDTVTALSWLPDGSGFISGGLDQMIILWVSSCPKFLGQSGLKLVFRMPMASNVNPGA